MPVMLRMARITFRVGLVLGLLLLVSFAWNGLSDRWRQPDVGVTSHAPRADVPGELRVLAFNVARAGAYRGGLSFAPAKAVERELDSLCEVIRREQVDLVFLSEVDPGGGPSPVDQVRHVAAGAGLHAWAFGANYVFGPHGYALRAGNAVLARFPLEGVGVEQLEAGARPFWAPTGNRRVLRARVRLGESWLPVLSVRNDSFDLERNRAHAEQILAGLPAGDVLLAGDFNAEPHDGSMQAFAVTGRWHGADRTEPTFPADAPQRRIDHVLAPSRWEFVSERVLRIGASDHRAVLAVYRLP